MKNERLTEEIKERIWTMREEGIRVHEIANTLGLSESGVYRVIQMKRVADLPLIDDSKAVSELKQKIAELEAENKNLLSDNRRLLGIIEKLIK